MKIHTLIRHHIVKAPREEVFAYYSDPYHLEKITPPSYHLNVLTPRPVTVETGTLIDYSVRWRGLLFRWTSLIIECHFPSNLIEVQTKGIFSSWHHQYTFETHKDGTRVVEVVQYAMPFGIFGEWVHKLLVEDDLRRLFDYRYSVLGHVFGSALKNE